MTNIAEVRYVAVFAALALAGSVLPAAADLIGTQVGGSAQVSGITANFFDPATGFVPAGFGNSSPNGPNNVVISASQIEFGLTSSGSDITADFTSNSLDLKYAQPEFPFVVAITFTFTDTAFAGLTIVPISDNFSSPGVTASLVGNVLMLSAPEPPGVGTFDAVFSIAPQTNPTARRPTDVRHRPRRVKSVWLAQQAQGASGHRLNKQINGNRMAVSQRPFYLRQ